MKRTISDFRWLLFFLIAVCVVSISSPAFSADEVVARLTSFSGTVMIKSQGSWGVEPEINLPLYSEDKIVTRIGVATLTFNDGAVMEIKANSNLLVKESEEEEGIGEKVKVVKRRLRLLLGKMFFRTGRGSGTKTTLETTTMVCGLRGTAGILSINAAGQPWLQFTEGGAEDTVGNFTVGVASDVPSELANLNEAQRAAFVAAAAARQAAQASQRAATGQISEADAAWAGAKAAETAAREAKAAAQAMLNNPDERIRNEAQAAIALADQAIADALAAQDAAIQAGATEGAVETYTPPEGETSGFDVEYFQVPQGIELDIPQEISGDTTPPVVSITTGPPTLTNFAGAHFEFAADEDVIFYYSVDNGVTWNSTVSVLDLVGIPEGANVLMLKAVDGSENESSIVSYNWSTDYTGPVVSLASNPAGIANTDDFSFSVTDANPDKLQYRTDTGDDEAGWIDLTSGSLDLGLPTDGSADGSQLIRVRGIDALGNKGAEVSYTWTYDTAAPTIVLLGSPEGDGETTVTATYTNDEPGSVTYTIDGVSTTSISDLAVGQHTVMVVATDQAGNTTSQSFSFTLNASTTTTTQIVGKGSDITGTATTETVSVDSSDPVGGGTLTSMDGNWTGTHTGKINMAAGEGDNYNGFLLQTMTGSIDPATGVATGTSEFTHLTPFRLQEASGTFDAVFNSDGTWTGTETSSGFVDDPLSFVSPFYASIMHAARYYQGEYYYTGTGAYGSEYYYYYHSDNSYGYTYIYDYNQSAPYDYTKTWTYYYSDGTTETYTNIYDGTDYTTSPSTYGTWDPATFDLSGLDAPPSQYGNDYYFDPYYYYDYVSTGYDGSMDGLLGGTESIWSVDTAAPVTVTGYAYDYSSSVWSTYYDIDSYNYNDDTYTTYDGGAYSLFLAGIKLNDVLKGGLIGIGVDPQGIAGYIRANDLEGNVFLNDMFKMKGNIKWEPRGTVSGVTAQNLISNMAYGSGNMGLSGKLGQNGSVGYGGGYDYGYYGYYGYYGSIQTASIADYTNYVAQPWGIYSGTLFGAFKNPDNASTWTSHVGGNADFGIYFTVDASGQPTVSWKNAWGYIPGAPSSSRANGKMRALVNGSFLTRTKLGTFEGEMLGTYDDKEELWEAESLGTWEGAPLSFVSEFNASIYHTTRYHYGKYDYSGGGYFYFNYYNDNSSGYYYDYPTSNSYPRTYVYFYGDGRMETEVYDASGNRVSRTYGTWDPDTESLTDLVPNPIPPSGENATLNYEYSYLTANSTGWMNGLMGGTASLWTGSDIPVTLKGDYYHYYDSIWSDYYDVYSYNYINNTYTTYDGGAYKGYLAGITQNNGFNNDTMEGRLIALYIAPDLSAGYLLGDFTGFGYPGTGSVEMDGKINRQPVPYSVGIAPGDLNNNIWSSNYYYDVNLSGQLGSGGTIGNVIDDYYYYYEGELHTMSIVDYTNYIAQPWGIYMVDDLYGTFTNPDPATTWTSHMGGEGAFGAYFDDNNNAHDDYGYFLGETSSTWENGRLNADFNGRFVSRTKMGHPDIISGTGINGEVLGTYNDDWGTWEAVSLGTWEGVPLDMSSYWDSYYFYTYNNTYAGDMDGVIGVISQENGFQYYALGEYDFYTTNYVGDTPAMYLTEITDWESGDTDAYAVGIMDNGTMDGLLAGTYETYNDSTGAPETAGFFYMDTTGNYYELDNYNHEGMWESLDTMTPIEILTGLTTDNYVVEGTPSYDYFNITDTGTIYGNGNGRSASVDILDSTDPSFLKSLGVWSMMIKNGTYDTATPTDGWTLSMEDYADIWLEIGPGSDDGTNSINSTWNSTTGDISAHVAGAWVDVSGAVTGVAGGRLKGTFDPTDTTSGVWQAVAAGAFLDTATFLDMVQNNQAALQALNIPCIEIGRDNLSGTGGYNGDTTVNMTDTIFFSYSTGAPPSIWATGNVTGSGSDGYNETWNTVPLTGTTTNLSADFEMRSWDTTAGTWSADVNNGAGTIGNYNITFEGGAAGAQPGDGTFTGTGSGAVTSATGVPTL